MNDYQLLETIRSEIHAEHTLISHRMAWYVTSQSFLMTAYSIAGGQNDWQSYFQFGMPLIGLFLCELARRGIWAAIRVQDDLIAIQSQLIVEMEERLDGKDDELRTLTFYKRTTCYGRPSADAEHERAMWPPKALPFVFAAAWIVALVYGLVVLVCRLVVRA